MGKWFIVSRTIDGRLYFNGEVQSREEGIEWLRRAAAECCPAHRLVHLNETEGVLHTSYSADDDVITAVVGGEEAEYILELLNQR